MYSATFGRSVRPPLRYLAPLSAARESHENGITPGSHQEPNDRHRAAGGCLFSCARGPPQPLAFVGTVVYSSFVFTVGDNPEIPTAELELMSLNFTCRNYRVLSVRVFMLVYWCAYRCICVVDDGFQSAGS